jgi:hypothetical protein
VLYLARVIDLIFFGAHPFPPYEPADLDCSGFVDVIDIAILIDYSFFGGVKPCAP